MPQYLSPGVYVEEVPSAVQPIAGVGTSTAAFIGVMLDEIEMPERAVVIDGGFASGDGSTKVFSLPQYPAATARGSFSFRVNSCFLMVSSRYSGTEAHPTIPYWV